MLIPLFICATGPPHSSAAAPEEPASCVGIAMEQGLQGVPGIFNPNTQGCQAMLLTGLWTASHWPRLLETPVYLCWVSSKGGLLQWRSSQLCLLSSLATGRVSALALRFSPTKHIPQPGIQPLKWERRHDVNKMGLVRLLGRWQCFKAAAVLESPCPEFLVFSTANPASAQPQEFPL